MKKTIIIFSLVLITIFSVSSFFIYTSYLFSYKLEYKSYIHANFLNLKHTTFFLNPSQLYINSTYLKWEDNNNEILINNKLYDIYSKKLIFGKIVLLLISDNEEQNIKQKYATNFDSKINCTPNHPLKLLKQFLSLKFLNTEFSIFTPPLNKNHSQINYRYLFRNNNIFLSIATPPPKSLA